MSAAVVGRASAAGMAVMALGFLLVGAIAEALEGLGAAVALVGIGYADEARVGSAAPGGGKSRQGAEDARG